MANDLSNDVHVEDAEVIDLPSAAQRVERDMKELAQELRRLFCERDQARISFKVEMFGEAHGDLQIEYTIANASYDTNKVSGDQILNAVHEFFRRKGWDNMHRPKKITYTGDERF